MRRLLHVARNTNAQPVCGTFHFQSTLQILTNRLPAPEQVSLGHVPILEMLGFELESMALRSLCELKAVGSRLGLPAGGMSV